MSARLLEGESGLVTGAARGIGRAIAQALAAEGAKLLLADVAPEVEEAAAALPGAKALRCELTGAQAARELAAQAQEHLGRVALLVHAASPQRREAQHALAVDEAAWREMHAVNLEAGFFLGQALGRHMRDTGIRGRMLYITSLHAYAPRNLAHYSSAKAGQTMVVRELARALGRHGIRVNAIAPGAIPSGGPQIGAEIGGRAALGRVGTPAEVAQMALALLSERFASYVTGATVAVDGGLALHNWIDPAA